MSSTRNEKARNIFLAIRNNDLDTFKKLISDSLQSLTVTDHSDDRLEKDLGGRWNGGSEEPNQIGGRWENNTPLLLALSLERLDFVEELIKVNKSQQRDIGINVTNNEGITPLNMLFMVDAVFSKKFNDTDGSWKGQLFTPEEKVNTLGQLKGAFNYLWPLSNDSTQTNFFSTGQHSLFSRLYHVIPELRIEIYKQAEKWFSNPDLKTKFNSEFRSYLSSAQQGGHESVYENVETLFRLMVTDPNPFFREYLREIMINPIPTSKRPHIFNFINNNRFSDISKMEAADKRAIISILDLVVTSDMYNLTNEKNEILLDILPAEFKIKRNLLSEDEIKENNINAVPEIKEVKEVNKVKEDANLQGKINDFEFRGQHRSLIKGAVACTSISMTLASRLLRMPNDEFFNVFKPGKELTSHELIIATDTLSGCVLSGVDLNKKISSKISTLLSRKNVNEVMKGIADLPDNFAGVKNIKLLDDKGVRVKDTEELTMIFPQKVGDYRQELLDKYQNDKQINENNLFFVATAGNHTTAFFSRVDPKGKTFYFITDSADSFTTSKMEVHDSWQSVSDSLNQKWRKADTADIYVFTLESPKLDLEHKQHAQIAINTSDRSQFTPAKIKNVGVSIANYISIGDDEVAKFGAPTHLSFWAKKRDPEGGLNKAKAYQSLLNLEDSNLLKLIILYALLNNAGPTLALGVLLELGYSDSKADIKSAKSDLKNRIEMELQMLGKDFSAIEKNIIKPIEKLTAKGVLASDEKYTNIKKGFSEILPSQSSPLEIKLGK